LIEGRAKGVAVSGGFGSVKGGRRFGGILRLSKVSGNSNSTQRSVGMFGRGGAAVCNPARSSRSLVAGQTGDRSMLR